MRNALIEVATVTSSAHTNNSTSKYHGLEGIEAVFCDETGVVYFHESHRPEAWLQTDHIVNLGDWR